MYLKAWRESKGITQEQLAKRAGVRVMTISDTERGKTKPRWLTLRAIERALRIKKGSLALSP